MKPKFPDGFQDMIDRYGSPHLWGLFERWINMWRLITEWMEIRIIIDMAVRCPDEALRTMALGKLRSEFEAARLDDTVPGKGCFVYDWDALTKARLAQLDQQETA